MKPTRSPIYGGLLIVGAMIAATAVTTISTPEPLRIGVYVLALVAALAGAALTLRDLNEPRSRGPSKR